jgi:hypothetical protein
MTDKQKSAIEIAIAALEDLSCNHCDYPPAEERATEALAAIRGAQEREITQVDGMGPRERAHQLLERIERRVSCQGDLRKGISHDWACEDVTGVIEDTIERCARIRSAPVEPECPHCHYHFKDEEAMAWHQRSLPCGPAPAETLADDAGVRGVVEEWLVSEADFNDEKDDARTVLQRIDAYRERAR